MGALSAPSSRGSLRAAVDAKCRDCTYDELEVGRWRQQVAACTITSCPLHAFRTMPRCRGAAGNSQVD